MKLTCRLVILCCLLWGTAPLVASTEHQVRATNVDITVDAQLDEAAWDTATVVDLPWETWPGDTVPAKIKTEVLFTYDSRNLYIAARCFDPEPDKIRARLTDRDNAFQDDWVGVVLDTFNDGRRAFEFFVNPLGVQMDLFLDDVNNSEDEAWNALWESAGRVTEIGYIVEMAIPFSSLRFPDTNGAPQTWGFDAMRTYPREHRYRFRRIEQDRDKDCYICQLEKLTGFEGISPGLNLEVVPTVVGTQFDAARPGSEGLQSGDAESELGLTVKWGITPNLTVNATYNPDFSQVEADAAQLDVNNAFALFFPETRPFFLEDADFFDTPINAVYTRTVADPDAGIKLTGKVGRHGIGVFGAVDTVTQITIPGSQRSRFASLNQEHQAAVLRYRMDVGERSNIGVLFTGREGENGDYYNRVGGIDGLWRLSDADTIRVQALASQTQYPDEIVDRFDQSEGELTDHALSLAYNHNTREWSWNVRYFDFGSDFRADSGFLPRVDYKQVIAGLTRRWYPEDTDESWWNEIGLGGDWDLTEDQEGQQLEREFEFWSWIGLDNQTWINFGSGGRTRFFRGRDFPGERFVWAEYSTQLNKTVRGGISARMNNDTIDFSNVQPADSYAIEPWFRFDIGKHIRVNLSHDFEELEVAGGRLFTANLTEMRFVYQFNKRFFVRLITQYFDLDREPSNYSFNVDQRVQDLFNQVLVSYKLNARTVFYLGYSDAYIADDERTDLVQQNRALFTKVGYAFTW
ncbi:MAG: DUF5916 domain-containing protein [Acidobacteriota bacterium]